MNICVHEHGGSLWADPFVPPWLELIMDTQWRAKGLSVGAAASSRESLVGFQDNVMLKSEGLRVCLWRIFQSFGS